METWYVIVHEGSVNGYAVSGVEAACSVLARIRQIKQEYRFLEISGSMQPFELHPDMPKPRRDLEVLVAGGFLGTCCAIQAVTLREKGYNAKFDLTACLPGRGDTKLLLREIAEQFPDLYDQLFEGGVY
jgi:hypothetical protein